MASPRATFRKHERLTGRDALSALMKEGKAMNDAPLRLIGRVMPLDSVSPAQVAFAIPKRHMRHATDRNRARRLLREAYRLEKEPWYAAMREAGVQCAWLFVWQSSRSLGFPATRDKLRALASRWISTHLPAKAPAA